MLTLMVLFCILMPHDNDIEDGIQDGRQITHLKKKTYIGYIYKHNWLSFHGQKCKVIIFA